MKNVRIADRAAGTPPGRSRRRSRRAPTGRGEARLYLVRHGRTRLNAEGRFRGRDDPRLDAVGVDEARRAAFRLRRVELVAVYASPLSRARQTARAIARPHRLKVRSDPAFLDLDYGRWTGRRPEEVARSSPGLYRRFRVDPESVRLPGGEAVGELRERVERGLEHLAARHAGRSFAVVTHDLPIRLVLARALGRSGAELWRGEVPTGSISRVTVGSGGFRLRRGPRAERPRRDQRLHAVRSKGG